MIASLRTTLRLGSILSEGVIRSALILGGAGGFGRAFKREFTGLDVDVTTADIRKGADVQLVDEAEQALVPLLSDVDLILLCLPEPAALEMHL